MDPIGRHPKQNTTIQVRLGPRTTWVLRQIARLEGISEHDTVRRAISMAVCSYLYDMLTDDGRDRVMVLREDWQEAVERLERAATEPAPAGVADYLSDSHRELRWLPF